MVFALLIIAAANKTKTKEPHGKLVHPLPQTKTYATYKASPVESTTDKKAYINRNWTISKQCKVSKKKDPMTKCSIDAQARTRGMRSSAMSLAQIN